MLGLPQIPPQPQVRRTEVVGLPKGWIREETQPAPRYAGYQNGIPNGGNSKSEVVYYTPRGQRIRNKNEMSRYFM